MDETASVRTAEPGPDEGARPLRLPVVFLPHGGGPWPFVEMGLDPLEVSRLVAYLQSIRTLPKRRPKALLVISAHWEASVATVSSAQRPSILYDYYGFPPESYRIEWPAPGDPELGARARELLTAAGFETAADAARGYDHGTFVPLKVIYPEADVPTVQLSLLSSLDPAEHVRMGRALAPLRDEGVFILASGMSFHNLRAFGNPRARAVAEAFDGWLRETAELPAADRNERLRAWDRAPGARQAHPREEHLMPLMVAAGAAGDDVGSVAYSEPFMGVRISAIHFA